MSSGPSPTLLLPRVEQTTYLGCTVTVTRDGYLAVRGGDVAWFGSMAMVRLWARRKRRAND